MATLIANSAAAPRLKIKAAASGYLSGSVENFVSCQNHACCWIQIKEDSVQNDGPRIMAAFETDNENASGFVVNVFVEYGTSPQLQNHKVLTTATLMFRVQLVDMLLLVAVDDGCEGVGQVTNMFRLVDNVAKFCVTLFCSSKFIAIFLTILYI